MKVLFATHNEAKLNRFKENHNFENGRNSSGNKSRKSKIFKR